MNCECNNKSNRVKPGIKHVYGNVLRMAIPLTLRTLVKDGDEMDVTDTDFIPSSDHPVRVVFSKGKTNYPIIATMDGNVAIVEDKGKIPVGTYDISVECYDDLGNPYRFKQNAVLYVADTTAEAGIDEEIEYEAQTWYLNAAVFLATTEIGEIGDVIDAKLDDVFGNVAYDADAKEIRFYNKGNSKVLATIDSSPFIADGTVADVYIDVSRQVLVVVLNEDAGGRMFSVPLYLVFNSYYKKDEVDNLVSRTVEGMRFDFSQELPLVVPVTKNGNSITSTVDFGAIDNAIREDGRLVVACVNDSEFYQLLDANLAEVSFSQVNALDGYQVLLNVDTHNVWSMEDVDLGTGGGGGYEPPAGGIPKTDLAPAVQASLAKADSALQPSDLQGYATTDDVDDAVAALVSSAPQTLDTLKELADALGDDPNFATTMATQLGNKVDKESGKGLSTNDYTTAEKTKLAELENYDDSALQTAIDGKVDKESGKSLMTDAERTKLQGIAAGAEVNVQADWTQTNTSADDYIKNKPTIPTKTSDLTNDSGFIDKAMYYGESTTAAATMPKVCTVETFPTTTSGNVTHAKDGTVIAVKFTNSDTNTTDAPTLNVNGIGAKAIMYNNAIVTSTAKNTTVAGTAKMLAYYRYDPALDGGNGAWEFLAKSVDSNSTYSNASLGQGYGTQTNSSAATAITSSISSYALSAGGIVTIKFTYDVPSNATLNISSKGAKAIYNQGAAIAAGVIKAGDTATFIYSTYYHLIAVDSWQDKQSAINDLDTIRSGAAKGATSVQSISVNGASLSPTDGNISISAVTGLQFDGSTHVGAVQLPEYVKKSDYDTTIDDIYQSIPSDLADMADDATHRLVTDTEKNTWNGKQNAISDLATIRSGASKGATAIQQADLAAVATSGSYNDLADKPTIPAAVTVDSTITQNGTNPVQGGAIYSALEGKTDKPIVVEIVDWGTYNEDSYGHQEWTGCELSFSYQEIMSAWNSGRQIYISDGENLYSLVGDPSEGYVSFSSFGWESNTTQTVIHVYSDNSALIVNKNNVVKTTRTINGHDLSSNITLTASDVGAVPTTRTINGKALSRNITLSASDIGALPSNTHIPADQVNSDWDASSGVAQILNKPSFKTINGESILGSGDIEAGSSDVATAFTITITSTTIEVQPMTGAMMTVGTDVSFQVV